MPAAATQYQTRHADEQSNVHHHKAYHAQTHKLEKTALNSETEIYGDDRGRRLHIFQLALGPFRLALCRTDDVSVAFEKAASNSSALQEQRIYGNR